MKIKKSIPAFIANRNFVKSQNFGIVPIYRVNIECEQFHYDGNSSKFILPNSSSFIVTACGRISSANLFESTIANFTHNPCSTHPKHLMFLCERFENGCFYFKNFLNFSFIEILHYDNACPIYIRRKYIGTTQLGEKVSTFMLPFVKSIRFGGYVSFNENWLFQRNFQCNEYIEFKFNFNYIPTIIYNFPQLKSILPINNHVVFDLNIITDEEVEEGKFTYQTYEEYHKYLESIPSLADRKLFLLIDLRNFFLNEYM